jgi:xanthine dehydrogenase accessory factor
MTLGPNTYAVIVTRGHKGDAEALQSVLGRDLRFVGLLGSKVKTVHIFSALAERGADRAALARVHAPLGIEIGAQTPEEIAVSILAEMIAIRRGVDPTRSASMKMALPERLKPGSSIA